MKLVWMPCFGHLHWSWMHNLFLPLHYCSTTQHQDAVYALRRAKSLHRQSLRLPTCNTKGRKARHSSCSHSLHTSQGRTDESEYYRMNQYACSHITSLIDMCLPINGYWSLLPNAMCTVLGLTVHLAEGGNHPRARHMRDEKG